MKALNVNEVEVISLRRKIHGFSVAGRRWNTSNSKKTWQKLQELLEYEQIELPQVEDELSHAGSELNFEAAQ